MLKELWTWVSPKNTSDGKSSPKVGEYSTGLTETASAATGLTSLAFGIACVAEPDPGTECAVLIAAVPLVTVPMAFGLAVVGAGFAGWLVRGYDENGVEPQTETNGHQDGSRTA